MTTLKIAMAAVMAVGSLSLAAPAFAAPHHHQVKKVKVCKVVKVGHHKKRVCRWTVRRW
jgi:hypothetical protein